MKCQQIINEFYGLIQENIKNNDLNNNGDFIKQNPFFIGEKAADARLKYNISRDIGYIHSDLIYLTGILFALKPYLNNPIKDNGRYIKNMYDSLFSMYASLCFEKLYNFWDRIGDKLANEFPQKFTDTKKIMFANVIDKLNSETNENIEWLKKFRHNDFKDFNNNRRLVVHYEHIETKYMEEILDNSGNMLKIQEIWEEKLKLPEYFKKQIELINLGLEKTYNFVESRR